MSARRPQASTGYLLARRLFTEYIARDGCACMVRVHGPAAMRAGIKEQYWGFDHVTAERIRNGLEWWPRRSA